MRVSKPLKAYASGSQCPVLSEIISKWPQQRQAAAASSSGKQQHAQHARSTHAARTAIPNTCVLLFDSSVAALQGGQERHPGSRKQPAVPCTTLLGRARRGRGAHLRVRYAVDGHHGEVVQVVHEVLVVVQRSHYVRYVQRLRAGRRYGYSTRIAPHGQPAFRTACRARPLPVCPAAQWRRHPRSSSSGGGSKRSPPRRRCGSRRSPQPRRPAGSPRRGSRQ